MTSEDEQLEGPIPALPVGQSMWTPAIVWTVSPGDEVVYWLRITVDGPIGTD